MTAKQQEAGLKIMMAMADAIREAGRLSQVALYAVMMGHVTLAAFNSLMDQLVATGLVRRERDDLVWVG